ncbi:MAG TPA: chorismate mutase [Caulobacteraceae bacterium]|nr:chorismate mutase [Caulobacteraceae bacterium]
MEANPALQALDAELMQRLAERTALAAEQAHPGGRPDLIGAFETETLRQLLAAPHPSLRPATLVRIWRELMAEARAGHGGTLPTRIAVWPGRDAARAIDLARLRFGAASPLTLEAQPEAALAVARTEGGVAVLALDGERPWWGRLLAEPSLKVFAALPCLASLGDTAALAVGLAAPEPTGADLTFWVTDANWPAPAVVEALGRDGVAAERLAEAGGLKLFVLAGYYQNLDPRLARAPGRLSGVIGAAPAPFRV